MNVGIAKQIIHAHFLKGIPVSELSMLFSIPQRQ